MSRKLVLILVLLILLPFLVYVTLLYVRFNSTEVPSGDPVRNINTRLNYTTIQAAIDANETLDGHTIFVEEGVYYERVIVKKAVSLIGENRSTTIIDGKGRDMGVTVTDKRITIKELTVRNCTTGIYLKNSNNSLVIENIAIFNDNAILVYDSVNCTFRQNILGNNTERGILVTNSRNFTVSNNRVYGNGISPYAGYGLNVNFSANGLIKQNYAYENDYDGIGLFDSSNCTVVENNVENNRLNGILLSTSPNNLVYHNNLINNTIQAADFDPTNRWDDGVEGNYWSNYGWFDLNHDGIGDTAQAVGGNQDNKPLMGQFHSFNTSMGFYVNVISNSTIEDFVFFESNSTLRIHVSNLSAAQLFGFCRICIPKALMDVINISVLINDGQTPVLYYNYTLYDNGTHRWIYFSYQHSILKIKIILVSIIPYSAIIHDCNTNGSDSLQKKEVHTHTSRKTSLEPEAHFSSIF